VDEHDRVGSEHDRAVEALAQDRAEELEARRAFSVLIEDRQRLAADLHDLVIQRLYACQLALSAEADDPGVVEQVIDDLDEAIRELRTCIYELRTSADTSPLIERLRLVLETASASHETVLTVTGTPSLIPDSIAKHALAVVREAVSNARRHADAETITLVVDVKPHRVTLRVGDDGRGLASEFLSADRQSGFANMRRRADLLDGLCIACVDDDGTTVSWSVPLPTEDGSR
jgi:signal transduction histidine kinase